VKTGNPQKKFAFRPSSAGQALLESIPMEISAGMTKKAGMISSGIH